MNHLNYDPPEINEKACNYAVLEYEINQILKEFDCPAEVHDEEKTIDYIFRKLSIIHNQIKILKSKHKIAEVECRSAEKRVEMYKTEIDLLTDHLDKKMDVASSLDSEWDDNTSDPWEEGAERWPTNVSFGKNLLAEPPAQERKSQMFKQLDEELPVETRSEENNNEILDMLDLNPAAVPKPAKINKITHGKFSFYPMSFLYTNNLISNKYLKPITNLTIP